MLNIKIFYKKLQLFGIKISDIVSGFVGTWAFIFLYTLAMCLWIGLHWAGILHIDSEDFIKWNLWLSYFAGTQASIVLMSSSRQAYQDRQKQQECLDFDLQTLKMTKDNNKKIQQLAKNMGLLEDVLNDLIGEKTNEGKNK